MKNPLKVLFTKRTPQIVSEELPLTDIELYSNLDMATFTYLAVLNDYKNKENQVLKIGEMTQTQIEDSFELVVDAALSSLNHIYREELKAVLLKIIPQDLSRVRKNLTNAEYLPPPVPQKFTDWIQGALTKRFPVRKHTSDGQFGHLMHIIASAFVQGNPPRSSKEITEWENSLISLLFIGTHSGIDEAAQIQDARGHSNRHSSQILMLSLILGVKHSRDKISKVTGYFGS